MKVNITFRCSICGSNEFIQPVDPQLQDEVTCVGCGQKLTVQLLLEQQLKASQELIAEQVRKTLKGP